MEIRETNFKRFIAAEGMALKWTAERWNYHEKRSEPTLSYSEHEALIDLNSLIGKVEEVPVAEYDEWVKDKCFEVHPLYR